MQNTPQLLFRFLAILSLIVIERIFDPRFGLRSRWISKNDPKGSKQRQLKKDIAHMISGKLSLSWRVAIYRAQRFFVRMVNYPQMHPAEKYKEMFLLGPALTDEPTLRAERESKQKAAGMPLAIRISQESHLEVAVSDGGLSRAGLVYGNKGLLNENLRQKIFETQPSVHIVSVVAYWPLVRREPSFLLALNPWILFPWGYPNMMLIAAFDLALSGCKTLHMQGVTMWLPDQLGNLYREPKEHGSTHAQHKQTVKNTLMHHEPRWNFEAMKTLSQIHNIEGQKINEILALSTDEYLRRLDAHYG